MPLGALLAGSVAEVIGEPMTIILSALISLGLLFFYGYEGQSRDGWNKRT